MTEYSDIEYAKDFIKLLSKFKQNERCDIVSISEKPCICSMEYYNFLSFKTMICELIYNAINNMPEIINEYTITCTNNKIKCEIKIGISDLLDNEEEISVFRIITPTKTYALNKTDVNTLYIANRTNFYNEFTVREFLSVIYGGQDGYEPIIKTSFVSVKSEKKEF